MIALAALLAAACLAVPAAAPAHQIGASYDTVARGVTPSTNGLTVAVDKGAGELRMVNRSDRTVLVYGYERDPYVRFDPDGKVFVNQRSPATYLNADIYADVALPDRADPRAKPVWKLEETDASYSWHDHRIHWMSPQPPRSVENAEARTKIFDWRVPIRVDDTRGAVTGTLYWAGSSEASPLASAVVFGASALIVIVGGLIWFRRTRDLEETESAPAEPRKEAW